jgi:hypothetical protein
MLYGVSLPCQPDICHLSPGQSQDRVAAADCEGWGLIRPFQTGLVKELLASPVLRGTTVSTHEWGLEYLAKSRSEGRSLL